MRTARAVTLVVVAFVLLSWALPAFAQGTSPADSGGADASQVQPAVTVPASQLEPAVPIPPPAPDDTTQPWTYRYLVPTGIALALLAVFVTIVQYFVRVVRSRYKLVR